MLGKTLGDAIDLVMQPVVGVVDIIDGLTEGELRTRAITRLGATIVAGMTVAELIEWYKNNESG